MKKTIIITALLFGFYTNAQEIPQLKLTPSGVEAIVVQTDSLKANELYSKALNWVQTTYKNPDKVLKSKIENESIRIDGFAENAWMYKTFVMTMFYNMDYTVEISFKDGKYRFEYRIGQFYGDNGQRILFDYSTFYKKDGTIRSVYADAPPSLEKTMNELSQSFYNYVTGKTSAKKNDW